ncbi:hypothetical protein PSP6_630030 [Paraburkholderia tropica]|nr:hypothetical protein PSP6_630030 [Paraburkholderia tropica]
MSIKRARDFPMLEDRVRDASALVFALVCLPLGGAFAAIVGMLAGYLGTIRSAPGSGRHSIEFLMCNQVSARANRCG